jgi:hypothetical protein
VPTPSPGWIRKKAEGKEPLFVEPVSGSDNIGSPRRANSINWRVERRTTIPQVPDDAIAKFRKLSDRADDYQVALQAAYSEAAHLRTEVARLRAALRHPLNGSQLELSEAGEPLTYDRRRGQLVVLDDVGLRVTARNLHKAEQDLKRAQARTVELSERFQLFKAIATSCEAALAEAGWWEAGRGTFVGGAGPAFPVPEGARPLEMPT